MTAQADLMRLREMLLQAEHGGMTNELLSSIESLASELFTADVVRLIKVLAADAREWRRRSEVRS
jgi:hypothetical protein